jgi:hypothetical protein
LSLKSLARCNGPVKHIVQVRVDDSNKDLLPVDAVSSPCHRLPDVTISLVKHIVKARVWVPQTRMCCLSKLSALYSHQRRVTYITASDEQMAGWADGVSRMSVLVTSAVPKPPTMCEIQIGEYVSGVLGAVSEGSRKGGGSRKLARIVMKGTETAASLASG